MAALALQLLRSPQLQAQSPPDPEPLPIPTGADASDNDSVGRIVLPFPVTVNGIRYGELEGGFHETPSVSTLALESGRLITILAEWIDPAIMKPLGLTADRPYLPLLTLENAGIPVRVDADDLSVSISVPPEMKREIDISIRPRPAAPERDTGEPAFLSGYLNLTLGLELTGLFTSEETGFRIPIRFEPVLNVGSWVLESAFTVMAGDAFSFVPNHVRLVKDLPERYLRFSAGDLSYGVYGFQRHRTLQGVMAARRLELSPEPELFDDRTVRIFLTEYSTVEVYVNGVMLRTERLAPGPYSIRDFALVNGVNTIELRILDASGRDERLFYTVPYSTRLLPPGETEFSYAFGVSPYSLDSPSFSGFHLFGLGRTVTAGVTFQGDLERQQLGGAVILASRIGTIGLDLAASHGSSAGFGAAAGMRLQHAFLTAPGRDTIGFSGTLISGGFVGLEPQELSAGSGTDKEYGLELSLRYGRKLPAGFSFTSRVNYSLEVGSPGPGTAGLSFFITRSMRGGLMLSASFDLSKRAGSSLDWNGSVSVRSSFPSSATSFSVRQNIETGETQAGFMAGSGTGQDARSVSIGLSGFPFVPSRSASLMLGANRPAGPFSFASTVSFSSAAGQDSPLRSRLSFKADTAVAWAGRHFALSRRITDSFAFVLPVKNLAGRTVGVNPGPGGWQAVSRSNRPAVIASLSSYRPNRLTAEPIDAPFGLDPGTTVFTLVPSYRSGFLVTVGAEHTAGAGGVLVDGTGAPVALEVLLVRKLGAGPGTEPVTSFTDRDGVFQILGLSDGIYRIGLPGDAAAAEFRLDTGAADPELGYIDLGYITLEAGEEGNTR